LQKQVISFFLLFILIVPAFVTYTWLQQHKRAIKREVKWEMIAGIDKSELVFFIFSNKDVQTKLRWEHAKEFEYKNQMYDVVEKKVSKDSTQLWCWWDYKETKLNKQLQILLVKVFQNDSQSKEKQNQVFKFYKLVYLPSSFDWKPFISKEYYRKTLCRNEFYISIPVLISLPPPKNA